MKLSKSLFLLIVIIVVLAVWGSFGLAINQFQNGNACPKIMGLPACYIALFSFLSIGLAHTIPFKNNDWVFFISLAVVLLLATVGTLGELFDFAQCPRTSGGIPMCFISLGICISLLVTKILYSRAT